MNYSATISSKGQMVIPAELRGELGLKAGACVSVLKSGNDLIVSPRRLAAVLGLCGKYEGMGLEATLIEEKCAERERDARKLTAS